MARELIELIPEVLARLDLHCLDLTGGAPELHPQFRELVSAARDLGVDVIDRCNLTILSEPGHEDLAEFLAAMGVRVVASLPCYEQERVDLQRGQGVYERSIAGLKKLNRLGYAQPGSPLQLDLVYNPSGPSSPLRRSLWRFNTARRCLQLMESRSQICSQSPTCRFNVLRGIYSIRVSSSPIGGFCVKRIDRTISMQ